MQLLPQGAFGARAGTRTSTASACWEHVPRPSAQAAAATPGGSLASVLPVDISILYSRPPGHTASPGTSAQRCVGTKAAPVACSLGSSAAAWRAPARSGPVRQLARNASRLNDWPPPLASRSLSKAGASSPRPEPASNESCIASNLASSASPPGSTLVTGKPKSRRTGGCLRRATSTSLLETCPPPPRSRDSNSLCRLFLSATPVAAGGAGAGAEAGAGAGAGAARGGGGGADSESMPPTLALMSRFWAFHICSRSARCSSMYFSYSGVPRSVILGLYSRCTSMRWGAAPRPPTKSSLGCGSRRLMSALKRARPATVKTRQGSSTGNARAPRPRPARKDPRAENIAQRRDCPALTETARGCEVA
mmetsp:Transcript_82901/g.261855  ORF Transcript_82901/g.261855 Transcript_82901/m.261855 type:complete len:364 (-) Transcript_82901:3-1094(-)